MSKREKTSLKKDKESLRKMLEKMHPEDIASLLDISDAEARKTIMNLLEIEGAAAVLPEVTEATRPKLLEELEDGRLSDILETMPADNATDILEKVSGEKRKKLLQLMEEKESDEVKELLKYGRETAGGIMTPEFVWLNENLSVNEAIEKLRTISLDHLGFYIYVTDEQRHLKGVLRLRKLIAARGETLLRDIMNPDLISVKTGVDQEEVAGLAGKYNLLAIPVVDEENKLAGIVTADDVIEVMEEEATEDIYKMAGTDDEELLDSSVLRVVRIRLPWLLTTLLGGLVLAVIIGIFRPILNQVLILAAFIPVIMGMGGNIGVQSSTIVVRGIATGRIALSDVGEILFKEVRIGAIMGLACGMTVGIVAHFWQGKPMLGAVVGVAMFIAITVAATIGTLTPLLFKRLRIDPAIAAGPFVTTSNDITGLLIYFGLATLLARYLV